jgi:hypothetical protein
MRHTNPARLLVPALLLWTAQSLTSPAHLSSAFIDQRARQLDEQSIEKMIADCGPIVYLRSDERYLLDDPEYVLDNGASLEWGIIENDGNYDLFQARRVESVQTSSKHLMDDVRAAKEAIRAYPESDKYKYWLKLDDGMKLGNLRRAKALVRVLPVSAFSTELQFWFFYPFNGPARVEVCAASSMCDDNWLQQAGRHYGDWERVSVLVGNSSNQVISVNMTRHDTDETFDRSDKGVLCSVKDRRRTLDTRGSHPVVYVAISSHANYPKPGNHNYKRIFSRRWGLGTASADLFDRTEAGIEFGTYQANHYRIISSDLPGVKVLEPSWLEFDGRWGQYEKLRDNITFSRANIKVYPYTELGRGPSGPKQKREWKGIFRPFTLP